MLYVNTSIVHSHPLCSYYSGVQTRHTVVVGGFLASPCCCSWMVWKGRLPMYEKSSRIWEDFPHLWSLPICSVFEFAMGQKVCRSRESQNHWIIWRPAKSGDLKGSQYMEDRNRTPHPNPTHPTSHHMDTPVFYVCECPCVVCEGASK
jgi:hypothetical protein